MAWRLSGALLVGMLGVTGASCGGDDGPGEGSPEFVCDKLDECNALRDGLSESECVEELEAALDDLTPTDRRDWETGAEQCAEYEGCDAYLNCWLGGD